MHSGAAGASFVVYGPLSYPDVRVARLHRNHSARIVQQATRPRVYVGGRRQGRGMSPQTLLAFEHRWPQHSGHKEEQIRTELGITPARYYQLLGRVARSSEGIAADPITARRVRERTRSRAA